MARTELTDEQWAAVTHTGGTIQEGADIYKFCMENLGLEESGSRSLCFATTY